MIENISMIAAIGKENELGIDNHLVWSLKEDMKFFRSTTSGKTIVMGRKCFESLPGLLPNRKHIIITSNKEYKVEGAIVLNSLEEALEYLKNTKEEVFIIGGAKIYEEFLPYAKKMYLTEIEDTKEADCYFPKFNKELYTKKVLDTKEENGINYSFVLYERI